MSVRKNIPAEFAHPTAVPKDSDQARQWQEANREWWESHPMRYDWKEPIRHVEYSREYYEEIDKRFFSKSWEFMPWKATPFDPIIDFEWLRDKDVLEVGVGNGSHAQLLASRARSYTGIDITDYAVKSTSKRLALFDIHARIIRMDAEQMDFPSESFDFVWTWGVIHHSSNTSYILREIHRVLKNGGRVVTMVYYRSWWSYYVIGLIFGLWKGELLRTKSLHAAVQHGTDGAIARYYTVREWAKLMATDFSVEEVFVCGGKNDIVPLPNGRMKEVLMRVIPDSVGRFLTRRLKMGSFLVSVADKKT